MKFTVIRDNQEKIGKWHWEESSYCNGTIEKHLKTGDYTLEGYESIVCVERKKTVLEIAQNVNEDRFYKELDRMDSIATSYIVCEFSFSDLLQYPSNIDLPPKIKGDLKTNGKYVLKRIQEIMLKHQVPFIFCDNKQGAWEFTNSLFKRIANG